MDFGGANWALMNIVGPLVLALVLLWVVVRSFRRRDRGGEDVERSERATHDLYDQEEAARREEDGS